MPRERRRRKQSGPRSGIGSLAWDKSRNRWVIRGYVKMPDGRVKRPKQYLPEYIDSPEAAAAHFKELSAAALLEKASTDLRAPARDVRGLCEAFLKRKTDASGFDVATAKQWSTMQGTTKMVDYDGEHLRAFRDAVDDMAAKPQKNLHKRVITTRGGVNRRIKSTRAIVAWGVSCGLVHPNLLAVLKTVEPLRATKAKTKDGPGRHPCTVAQFEAAAEWVTEIGHRVALIVQRWTGARPTEILSLRVCDIDTTEEIWVARPAKSKTKHYGIVREIYLPKPARDALESFIDGLPRDVHIFDHRRWNKARRANCPSPRRPNQKPNPRKAARKFSPHLTEGEYRDAVLEACECARENGLDCPDFTPYQLCHLRLSEITAALGIKHASATRQHTTVTMTADYAKEELTAERRRLSIEAARVGVA